MTNRSCKTCRHWDVAPDQCTKTGRLKKDAVGLCRYPIGDHLFPRMPYSLHSWLRRQMAYLDNCGMTGKDDGISCMTWADKP
jgi:hypothetical protein